MTRGGKKHVEAYQQGLAEAVERAGRRLAIRLSCPECGKAGFWNQVDGTFSHDGDIARAKYRESMIEMEADDDFYLGPNRRWWVWIPPRGCRAVSHRKVW